jgi:hypothetical protein
MSAALPQNLNKFRNDLLYRMASNGHLFGAVLDSLGTNFSAEKQRTLFRFIFAKGKVDAESALALLPYVYGVTPGEVTEQVLEEERDGVMLS